MGNHTLTINDQAYSLLSKHKAPGESFSRVLVRLLPLPPCKTGGEILKALARMPDRDFTEDNDLDQVMEEQLGHVPR